MTSETIVYMACCSYLSITSNDLSLTLRGHKFSAENALRWRHNGRDGVSNHQPHHGLLNRLFRHRSKKSSKLRVTGLCAGNSPGTCAFHAQMASNAENVSIWWRHHGVAAYGKICDIWYGKTIMILTISPPDKNSMARLISMNIIRSLKLQFWMPYFFYW